MRKLGCTTVVLGLLLLGVPLALVLGAPRRPAASADMSMVSSVSGIPPRMLTAYQSAAAQTPREAPRCRGMRWAVLAGIAEIESHHAAGHRISATGDISPHIIGPRLDGSGVGENTTPVADSDGGRWDDDPHGEHAVGPFQFLPSTWTGGAARDGNHDGVKDPHNADDAALAAAVYLCGNGRNLTDPAQLRAAIYAYNHSDSYVQEVTDWIKRYTQLGTATASPTTGSAAAVLRAALSQTGVPYSWGGGGPDGPSYGGCCSPAGRSGAAIRGFDCSGLTQYAFARAGIVLPRTADAQAGAGRRIPADAGVSALRPGDLVFFAYDPGNDATIYHVGISLGSGQMVNAPRPGAEVRSEAVWTHGYAGGARLL
ncbi:NlpC/P60 family protein [Streptomyces luteireticuli]|uniref:C40 family peptidase n=1 Tax=Streptomyces luteireticuli TaxID=173858 RepID=UPI00355870B8